jgi:hypothetical protein
MAPAEAEPVRTVLRVRTNRRRHGWTAIIGLPTAFVLPSLVPPGLDPTAQFLTGLLIGVPGGLAAGSIALLLRRVYLTYDARERTIRGPGYWRNNTTYPRAGYDRLEYSPYDARIYEVRADGKRRRLILRRWVANPQDWKALVDLLLTPQHPASGSD